MFPISSAPKNGEKIFIFNENWKCAPIAKWGIAHGESAFLAWILYSEHCRESLGDGVIGWKEDIIDGNMPTHWMPIPESDTCHMPNEIYVWKWHCGFLECNENPIGPPHKHAKYIKANK